MNILCASDKVIIPVEASPWGMFGLANMFEFLNEVKQIAPELEVAGIAVTKVDTRKELFQTDNGNFASAGKYSCIRQCDPCRQFH